jgi:hypothetical protein
VAATTLRVHFGGHVARIANGLSASEPRIVLGKVRHSTEVQYVNVLRIVAGADIDVRGDSLEVYSFWANELF